MFLNYNFYCSNPKSSELFSQLCPFFFFLVFVFVFIFVFVFVFLFFGFLGFLSVSLASGSDLPLLQLTTRNGFTSSIVA